MTAKVDFEFFRGETHTLTVAHGQSETPSVAMIGFRYPSSDDGPLYLSKSSEWSPDDFSIDATNVTITIKPSDTETIHALPYYYSVAIRLADGTQKVIQYGIASVKGSTLGDAFDVPPNFFIVGVTKQQRAALDASDISSGAFAASRHAGTHSESGDDPITPGSIGAAKSSDLQAHISDTNNPHSVTPALIGASPSNHTHAIGDLSDVSTSGWADGYVLKFDASGNLSPGTVGSNVSELNDLSDVNTTGATSGQGLIFDGSVWRAGAGGVLLVDDKLVSDVASWDITIPNAASYQMLVIFIDARSTRTDSDVDAVECYPNGATTGLYSGTTIFPFASHGSYANWTLGSVATDKVTDADAYGVISARIYHGGKSYPVFTSHFVRNNGKSDSGAAAGSFVGAGAGGIISSLTLSMTVDNFKAGSRVRVFGVTEVI